MPGLTPMKEARSDTSEKVQKQVTPKSHPRRLSRTSRTASSLNQRRGIVPQGTQAGSKRSYRDQKFEMLNMFCRVVRILMKVLVKARWLCGPIHAPGDANRTCQAQARRGHGGETRLASVLARIF